MIEPKPRMKFSHKIWIGVGITLAVLGICLGVILIWTVSWILLGVVGGIGIIILIEYLGWAPTPHFPYL